MLSLLARFLPAKDYSKLSTDEDTTVAYGIKEKIGATQDLDHDENPSTSPLAKYTLVLCAVCALSSILLSSFITPRASPYADMHLLQPELHKGLTHLRRPPQFPNLDRVERPPLSDSDASNASIVNFPLNIGKIRSLGDDDSQTMPIDLCTKRFLSDDSEQRCIEVKQDVSTIIQFRSIDWGMETCTLHISLPSGSTGETPFQWSSESEGQNISGNFITIQKVKAPTLRNWQNRDKCTTDAIPLVLQEKLGEVHLVRDSETTWSHSFHCHTDSLQTFVLKRGDGSTIDLQWWQDKMNLTPAIYITQHPTV